MSKVEVGQIRFALVGLRILRLAVCARTEDGFLAVPLGWGRPLTDDEFRGDAGVFRCWLGLEADAEALGSMLQWPGRVSGNDLRDVGRMYESAESGWPVPADIRARSGSPVLDARDPRTWELSRMFRTVLDWTKSKGAGK